MKRLPTKLTIKLPTELSSSAANWLGLTALVALGLLASRLHVPLCPHHDYVLLSVFSLSLWQFYGLRRSIIPIALIAVLSAQPGELLLSTALACTEILAVAILVRRYRLRLVLADAIFWLSVGPVASVLLPTVIPLASPMMLNGIANALFARLIYLAWILYRRNTLVSFRDLSFHLMVAFGLLPMLLALALSDGAAHFTADAAPQLQIALVILSGILWAAEWISRQTVATLNQLSGLTSELPAKLASGIGRLDWPQTSVAETRMLITNFKVMTASLSALLTGERQIHEKLDAQVADRTAALSDSLREKEALLREVHHRVKNNLQVISSMLRLESSRHPGSATVLDDMQSRIHSMALLHETVYRTERFAAIDLGSYLQQIATQAMRTLQPMPPRVQLRLTLGHLPVDLDRATPCGLLANELLSNSLKHAFPEGRAGTIDVKLEALGDDRWRFSVTDDGIGLPPDFNPQLQSGLGLKLATGLAEQIGGPLHVSPHASFSVTFVQAPLASAFSTR